MVSFRILALTLFAGLATAAPLDVDADEDNVLLPRQSSSWNDKYVKKPYRERAQHLGGCAYQITFRRDGYDSAHHSTEVADDGRYAIPNNTDHYVISVHRFRSACSSGSSGTRPTAFFVRATLDSTYYTFENDYLSLVFTAMTQTLPTPPSGVRIVRGSGDGDYTASWTAEASATGGFYVLLRVDVFASELGTYVPTTRTILAGAGQTSVHFRVSAGKRLSSVAVSSQAGTDVVSDGTQVVPVAAPQ
ncbi:hypothetical protein V8E36_001560 [Tilletia maclaganii]